MKRSNLLISATLIVALSAIVFIGCQKNEDNIVTNNGQPTTFSLQGDEAIASILNFRKQVEAYKKNPTMKSSETMSIAEAIWNIENLFNLTYAAPEEYYSETEEFEFSLYLPIDAQGNVMATDLYSLYEQARATARNCYANTGFADKGFLFMTVELAEQGSNTVRIDFNGKVGERCAQPEGYTDWNSNVSIMYFGPFNETDNWGFALGMGRCGEDETGTDSGADKELERNLRNYLREIAGAPETGSRAVYLNEVTLIFDGLNHSNDVFYNEDVTATCINFNNMNRLYQREKRLIFEDIPNGLYYDLFGYTPTFIQIDGQYQSYITPQNEVINYISHINTIIYVQRLLASINTVGEVQDLLNN